MGRILGIDYGLRRVGAALSDPGRSIATPLEVHERQSPARDAHHYVELVAEEGIERIVVGLPVHASGEEGESARAARAFGTWLAEVTGCPVVFYDERYTTTIAEEILRSSGIKAGKRKALRDQIAAQVLLQAYLDAGCPETVEPPGSLDDDAVEDA